MKSKYGGGNWWRSSRWIDYYSPCSLSQIEKDSISNEVYSGFPFDNFKQTAFGMASEIVLLYVLSFVIIYMLTLIFPTPRGRKYLQDLLTFPHRPKSVDAEKQKIDNESRPRQPSSWFMKEKHYQLERRSVFCIQWLYITHVSRFKKAGDYRTFEIAGFSILLILGKDKQIRSFHNVCRHRAYTVAKKEFGSSIVLGCRYHGWSYDTKGELVKAPEFDKVPGFDKSVNGLWELKCVTKDGLVFINFDNRDVVVPLPCQPAFKMQHMNFVAEWKIEAAFNWKLAATIPKKSLRQNGRLWGAVPTFVSAEQETMITPNTLIRKLNTKLTMTMRLLPTSAVSTIVECCIYTTTSPLLVSEDLIEASKESMCAKIEELQVEQRQLQTGQIYSTNPFVDEIAQLLASHQQAEKKAGFEINPAAQKRNKSKNGTDDDDLCRKAEQKTLSICQANTDGLLDW